MRPTLYGDVACAARVLYRLPQMEWEATRRRMICEADIADRYPDLHQKVHPRYGNGSLMSVARMRSLPPEPFFDDPDYCACFEMVLRQVREYWIRSRRS